MKACFCLKYESILVSLEKDAQKLYNLANLGTQFLNPGQDPGCTSDVFYPMEKVHPYQGCWGTAECSPRFTLDACARFMPGHVMECTSVHKNTPTFWKVNNMSCGASGVCGQSLDCYWADLGGWGRGRGRSRNSKHQELAPAHSSSPGLVLVRNNIVL